MWSDRRTFLHSDAIKKTCDKKATNTLQYDLDISRVIFYHHFLASDLCSRILNGKIGNVLGDRCQMTDSDCQAFCSAVL